MTPRDGTSRSRSHSLSVRGSSARLSGARRCSPDGHSSGSRRPLSQRGHVAGQSAGCASLGESITRYVPQPGHRLARAALQDFADAPHFGERLCRNPATVLTRVYDHVAHHAHGRLHPKQTDIVTTMWRVQTHRAFHSPVNLSPMNDRGSFSCVGDVYDLRAAPAQALVVMPSHKHVGGGCFRKGFLPQEQMILQSQDLAIRLHTSRPYLDWNEGVTFEGVHFDAWWPKEVVARGASLISSDILPAATPPCTVLAVDAPFMRLAYGYDRASLCTLVCKIILVHATAIQLNSPAIFTCLIGADAFHNNRPLILLLHLLLAPHGSNRPVIFHHPVLCQPGFSSASRHERAILLRADEYLSALRSARVRSVQDAIEHILAWNLPTSWLDHDLTASAHNPCTRGSAV